jgi:hypothetical protein
MTSPISPTTTTLRDLAREGTHRRPWRVADMAGKRFGMLTGIRRDGYHGREVAWLFKCDCGAVVKPCARMVRRGSIVSCGCYRRIEMTRRLVDLNTTHGKSGTTTHTIWHGIIQRCLSQTHHAYPDYGGRGIGVCARWQESFSNFLADMGERPPGMSIDRIDNDGNYEPGNCRWATRTEQASNTRRSRKLTHGGETMTMSGWSRRIGISPSTLSERLTRMSVGDALSLPKQTTRRRP